MKIGISSPPPHDHRKPIRALVNSGHVLLPGKGNSRDIHPAQSLIMGESHEALFGQILPWRRGLIMSTPSVSDRTLISPAGTLTVTTPSRTAGTSAAVGAAPTVIGRDENSALVLAHSS